MAWRGERILHAAFESFFQCNLFQNKKRIWLWTCGDFAFGQHGDVSERKSGICLGKTGTGKVVSESCYCVYDWPVVYVCLQGAGDRDLCSNFEVFQADHRWNTVLWSKKYCYDLIRSENHPANGRQICDYYGNFSTCTERFYGAIRIGRSLFVCRLYRRSGYSHSS